MLLVFGLIPVGDEYQPAWINALWLYALSTEDTLGLSDSRCHSLTIADTSHPQCWSRGYSCKLAGPGWHVLLGLNSYKPASQRPFRMNSSLFQSSKVLRDEDANGAAGHGDD